jgi:hypothetical protein
MMQVREGQVKLELKAMTSFICRLLNKEQTIEILSSGAVATLKQKNDTWNQTCRNGF